MSAVGDLVGNVVGGITGSKQAGEAQERAAQQGMAISQEQFEAMQKNLQPFMQFGTGLLPQLGETMAPLDRQKELQAYYQSPEFNMMSDVARGQQLAASEATGGLGSTSTGNVLASIAPQLGQQYLGSRMAEQTDLYNRLMGGVNVGLGAATSTGAAGQQYASQASNLLAQQGAAQAGAAMAPFQTLMQLGKMGAGAYTGGYVLMVQPINYGGMIAQSMEGLGPALRDVGLESQRRQQQQENQQLLSNAAELYKTGTPEQIAEFSIKNPQIGDILGQQIGYRNERTKQIMADTLGRALTASPEQRREIITQGADAIRAAGGDPRNLITATEDSPEDFERGALMALASTGDYGKGYLSAYQASKPKEMTEYQQEMVRQKDTAQELKRLEIEQKKLDAQYKRETDELKRQELERKISDNERRATEAREAKELSKQQAVTSTQQTLESVDELLNHPGLDAAVGGTSLLPTRPGSDAANFETALESFVGNLTMENMGVMKGVLSDSDIKMIRAASSGLDIGMSEKAFKARLNKIKERLQSKLKQQGGQTKTQEQQKYTEGQTATNPQTGERLVFRGGQWQTM